MLNNIYMLDDNDDEEEDFNPLFFSKDDIKNIKKFDSDLSKKRPDIVESFCAICHKLITRNFDICTDCETEWGIKGKNKRDWPKWILELVNSTRRERYQEIAFRSNADDSLFEVEDEDGNLYSELEYDEWDNVDDKLDEDIDLDRLLQILTPRETEVLHMLMDGYKDEEIAVKLSLPQPNINYYHRQIREKATSLGILRL